MLAIEPRGITRSYRPPIDTLAGHHPPGRIVAKAPMADRHRLDHDLDPNQHRYLGGRGADATYSADGDLTLGQGNYFKITPASTATLRRIAGVDWTAGSPVVLEPTVTTTFAPGSSSGGGFYGMTTPTGENLVVEAGAPVAVSFDGLLWRVHKAAVTLPAADDHLIKARNEDATTVGGIYDKTIDSTTVTREVVTDSGVEKVRFNAVPATPPAGEGSWLYTGSIQASNLHDPVKAFVKSLEGMGGLDPGQSALFNVVGATYEHKVVGQLYGLAPDGTETFAIAEGQRVWLSMWLDSGSTYRGGFCTVTTLGDGSTKAVLTPTADDVAVGSMFKVEGVGAEYENWYWEVLSIPDNTLAYRPDYASATTYNLFTSTEVIQAGSVTRETSVTIPGGTSGGTQFAIPYFEMLSALGVSTIPKGVVNWRVNAYLVSDDPAATVFIRAHLTTDQGVSENFGFADSAPMHNTSATVLEFQGTIAADRTVDPSDKMGALFSGFSNSASAVTIKLVYNDASHLTRVQTPLATASFGTLDHQLLTMESRGFVAGQEAAASRSRHPQRAIESVASVPTSLIDGDLTPDPTADIVIISTASTVSRIDTSQWPGGTGHLTLFFPLGGTLDQSVGGSGDFANLDLGNFGGLSPLQASTLELGNNASAKLLLLGNAWHLLWYNAGTVTVPE